MAGKFSRLLLFTAAAGAVAAGAYYYLQNKNASKYDELDEDDDFDDFSEELDEDEGADSSRSYVDLNPEKNTDGNNTAETAENAAAAFKTAETKVEEFFDDDADDAAEPV
ncbi:MAG: hypothetical protein MR430_07135 [Lachnospiraceae bacterium]|nr:hypothetical protein [Lachnospiraceae bacterium]